MALRGSEDANHLLTPNCIPVIRDCGETNMSCLHTHLIALLKGFGRTESGIYVKGLTEYLILVIFPKKFSKLTLQK